MFENKAEREEHARYYLPTMGIKDCNVMIDGRSLFDQPIRNNVKMYENIRRIVIVQGDDFATGCLLDCLYFKKIITWLQ